MTFDMYLHEKRYSESTRRSYLLKEKLFAGWLDEQSLSGYVATYNDVIAFMRDQQTDGKSKKAVADLLNVLRHYFTYLITENKRIDNPAAGLYIKGIVRTLPGNLLAMEELEDLYRLYQLQLRVDPEKKLMLGLMIYQGLHTEEMGRLEAAHIHLREGKVFIKAGPDSNERWLLLQAHQVLELQQYLHANRFKEGIFLARAARANVSKINISNQVRWMILQLQQLNPRVVNANQIRASVITAWLQQYNLRQVQYMAGHRYVSSTARYQLSDKSDLQSELQKHHPMG